MALKNSTDIPEFSVAKAGKIVLLNSIIMKTLIYDWLDLTHLG